MNYKKIYDDLIYNAKNSPKLDLYKENHHILPKCMGGDDSSENIVKLTAKQHFVAHWLLYKIYKTPKLCHAWNNMSMIGVGQEARRINSRYFDRAKKERSRLLSINSKGEKNHFYGKTHSPETRTHISQALTGKIVKTPDQIKNWVEKVAKKPKSLEHRKKISRKGFIMLCNKDTLKSIRIHKDEVENYDSSIWMNIHKVKPQPTKTCEHCGMITIFGNYSRWHGEKCKKKHEN